MEDRIEYAEDGTVGVWHHGLSAVYASTFSHVAYYVTITAANKNYQCVRNGDKYKSGFFLFIQEQLGHTTLKYTYRVG